MPMRLFGIVTLRVAGSRAFLPVVNLVILSGVSTVIRESIITHASAFPPPALFTDMPTTPSLFASIWPVTGTAGAGAVCVLSPLIYLGMGALAAALAVRMGGRLSDLDRPVLSWSHRISSMGSSWSSSSRLPTSEAIDPMPSDLESQ